VAAARKLPEAPSAWEESVLVQPAVLVLADRMPAASQVVLELAELCPRMAEQEAQADRRQVKTEAPCKVEARKRQAGQLPRSTQIESRTREVASQAAPAAKQLSNPVEPRRRVLARVAVAASWAASQGNGTNCCLFSARWDFGVAGGIALAMSGALKSERRTNSATAAVLRTETATATVAAAGRAQLARRAYPFCRTTWVALGVVTC